MKIQPVASPHAIQTPQTTSNTEARDRAISKLTAQQPVPLENPQNVSVEELGAITVPTAKTQSSDIPEGTLPVEKKEEPAKSTEDASYSSQLALLARKERALRAKAQQQEQAIKARETALKAKEAEMAAKLQEYESNYVSKQRLKERTLDTLAEVGKSYDDITQEQIAAGDVNPSVKAYIERLEARQAKLEAQIEESRQGQAKQQDEAYKAALRQIELDAKDLVRNDPEFETIKATGSTKDVVELIEAHFKDTGRVMSVEEAAKLVEDHLVEEIDKLTKIEKIKKRQAAQNASEKPVQAATNAPKQPQPMKTLTNAAASTRSLSAKERAILAFRGELKS